MVGVSFDDGGVAVAWGSPFLSVKGSLATNMRLVRFSTLACDWGGGRSSRGVANFGSSWFERAVRLQFTLAWLDRCAGYLPAVERVFLYVKHFLGCLALCKLHETEAT